VWKIAASDWFSKGAPPVAIEILGDMAQWKGI
jgi:hypothetical protein